jgi:FkbM family methyltransferase
MNTRLKNAIFSCVTGLLGDRQGYVTLPVLRGPLRGKRFKLDLVRRMESAYCLGKYDRDMLEVLARIIRGGWRVWDCGTYLGYYTLFFATCVGRTGKVLAVEADPNNLERTRHNVRLNRADNVLFVNACVSDRDGEVTFLSCPNSNSHLPGTYVGGDRRAYEESVERGGVELRVPSVSPDALLARHPLFRPDLIKLDIDGAELFALRAAEQLATQVRPLVLLELHNPDCDRAAYEFGARYDYRLVSFPGLVRLERPIDVQGTLLCVPSEKAALVAV